MVKYFLSLAAALLWAAGSSAGEPSLEAKRAEWENFKRNFRVDYSDGTKHLRPTEGNRFAKPFAVTTAEGRPACRIVYNAGSEWSQRLSNETTCRAATELQRLIRLVTGVTVPVNPEGSSPEAKLPALRVGKGTFHPFGLVKTGADFLADLEYLRGTDGYAIRGRGEDVAVYGLTEKGTLNGVFALMENNTDLVFTRPNAKAGVVFTPQTNGFSLVWGEGVRSRPAAAIRGFQAYTDWEYWSANYMTETPRPWGEALPFTRYGHNVNRYAGGHAGRYAEKSTFETHPEFYGLVAGVRDRVYGNQLCFTNPELRKTFIANVLHEADFWPETEFAGINFSLDDSMNWCECADCRRPIDLPDGTRIGPEDPAFMSTRYFLFVNDVARALRSAHPNLRIKTLAYFQTAEPPRCPVEDNVEIEFCPYMRVNDTNPVYARENAIWLDRARRWYEQTGRRIRMYGYNGLGLAFPRPLCHVHQRDFREYFRYLSGIDSEGGGGIDNPFAAEPDAVTKAFDWSAIEFWVMSRLYWNPEQDVEQLYKKFCYRAFREAAKPMERFYGEIRAEWFRQSPLSGIGETATEGVKRIMMGTGREAEFRGYLDEALAGVRHPAAKFLVERVKARFEEAVRAVKEQKTSELVVPQIVVRETVGWETPAWTDAACIDGFWAMPKGDKPAGSKTELRLFHDGRRLYVKGTFFEEMSRCRCAKVKDPEKTGLAEGSLFETFIANPSVPGEYYLYQIDAAGNVCDYRGTDCSWNRKDASLEWRRGEDRWEVLLTFPLREIGCDLTKDNRVRAAFIRIRDSAAPDNPKGHECDYGAWRWCLWHQLNTFGTLTLQR